MKENIIAVFLQQIGKYFWQVWHEFYFIFLNVKKVTFDTLPFKMQLVLNMCSLLLVDFSFVVAASALMALHLKGIVHRDLKPQNILISKNEQQKTNPLFFVLKIGIYLFHKSLNFTSFTFYFCHDD